MLSDAFNSMFTLVMKVSIIGFLKLILGSVKRGLRL